MSRLPILLVAFAVSGCALNTSAMRPQALGAGNFEAAIEPAVIGGAGGGAVSCCLPLLNSSFRWGVNDTTDLGFRVGFSGVYFVSKFQLSEGDTVISLAPEVGGFAFGTSETGGGGAVQADLPLLIGLAAGERSQVILGPGIRMNYFFGSSGGSSAGGAVLSPTLSAGYSAWASDSIGFIPSLTLMIPVVGTASADGESATTASVGGVAIGFQLGVMFGTSGRN
jgi:hypothetical protein